MKFIYSFIAIVSLLGAGALFYTIGGEGQELDPALESVLEEQYGIAPGSFTPDKVRAITELDISGRGIRRMDGLEHFHSLQKLDASHNIIENAAELEGLGKLESVDLSFNQLETASFASPALHTIDLEGNRLEQMGFVKHLAELRELNMRDNDLVEVSFLTAAKALTHLNLRGNRIRNIEPLSQLPNLIDLNLRNNEIIDYGPLDELPNLSERLYVTGNPGTDYTELDRLSRMVRDVDFELRWKKPTVNVESGLIGEDATIELFTDVEGAWIFYTLDGSEPTASATKYEGPILINSENMQEMPIIANTETSIYREPFSLKAEQVKEAAVLRASVYYRGQFSPTVTHTYFLEENATKLPIISLSLDNADLFDSKRGIYVPGDFYRATNFSSEGNYFQRGRDWERKASLEWFEQGERVFQQDVGVRIHGGYSRSLPQKSLRVYARDEFDAASLNFPFFGEDKRDQFDRILLRNAGNDHAGAFFRDALMHHLVEDGPVETMDAAPAIVLLNGEYWGIHNVRDSYSAEWFETRYNVPAGDVVIIETDKLAEEGFAVDEGKAADLGSFMELFDGTKENARIDYLAQRMDISNYLHYLAYQVYFANTDSFGNNTAVWRKRGAVHDEAPDGHDGKWRWLLYDTDQGFGGNPNLIDGYAHDTLAWALEDKPQNRLTRDLLADEETRARFIEIMQALLLDEFNTERVIEEIDRMETAIAEEMPKHITRWQAPADIATWRTEVEALREFAEKRPSYILEQLEALEREN